MSDRVFSIVAVRCRCGWEDTISTNYADEPLSVGAAWMLRQVEAHEADAHRLPPSVIIATANDDDEERDDAAS